MKTLTEFFGQSLKSIEEKMALIEAEVKQTLQEALKTEGKSEEEIQTALPEAIKTALQAKLTEMTKLEGDKLAWFMSAAQLVKEVKGRVKRVIVMAANEGEKIAEGLKEIEGKYFSIELFPEPVVARPKRFGSKGRDHKGGDKKGHDRKGRRDDKRGGAERSASSFPRSPQGPARDAKRAEKEAARNAAREARKAAYEAKVQAALATEPPYDGKTNRIKIVSKVSAPQIDSSSASETSAT